MARKPKCDCDKAYKSDKCIICGHVHYAMTEEGHYHKKGFYVKEPPIYFYKSMSISKLKNHIEKQRELVGHSKDVKHDYRSGYLAGLEFVLGIIERC